MATFLLTSRSLLTRTLSCSSKILLTPRFTSRRSASFGQCELGFITEPSQSRRAPMSCGSGLGDTTNMIDLSEGIADHVASRTRQGCRHIPPGLRRVSADKRVGGDQGTLSFPADGRNQRHRRVGVGKSTGPSPAKGGAKMRGLATTLQPVPRPPF